MRNPQNGNHGVCPNCGTALLPDMFIEEETVVDPRYHTLYKTGRRRTACNCLYCPMCGKKETVDDEYLAGPWR